MKNEIKIQFLKNKEDQKNGKEQAWQPSQSTSLYYSAVTTNIFLLRRNNTNWTRIQAQKIKYLSIKNMVLPDRC